MSQPVAKSPQKPSGTIHFKPRSNVPSVKVQLPYDPSSIPFEMLTQKIVVNVIDCDEKECRDFLVAMIQFLEAQKPCVDVYKYDFDDYNYQLICVSCTLDRMCLHLLAKLKAWEFSTYIGYGTQIVSFENANDFIRCLTELQLESVIQEELFTELPLEIFRNIQASQRLERDQEDREPDMRDQKASELDDYDELGNNESEIEDKEDAMVKTNELINSNNKEEEENEVWNEDFVSHVNLRFGIKPGLIHVKELENANKLFSTTYKVEMNARSRKHLSPIAILALQVPTLNILIVDSVHVEVFGKKMVEFLTGRPASSCPLDISIPGNHLMISDEFLDVFNEKKLTRMAIEFEEEFDAPLLDKVVKTISKSLHIQTLEIGLPRFDLSSQVNILLDGIIKAAPGFRHPIRLSVPFRGDGFRTVHRAPFSMIRYKIRWIEKIMQLKDNKDLQIIQSFVDAVVLKRCYRSSLTMLSVDLIRKLRDMLLAMPKIEKSKTFCVYRHRHQPLPDV